MPNERASKKPRRDQARLAALVARIALKDEAALREFLEAVEHDIYLHAIPIVRNHAVAEDVVAECSWQMWLQSSRYSSERGTVRSWISAIARTRAIDLARQHEAIDRRNVHLQQEISLVSDAAGGSARRRHTRTRPRHVNCPMERHSLDARLRSVLCAATPAHRQILVLAFYFGLSQLEIARHCAMPLGTVKSHMRRGLIAVKESCLAAGISGTL